MDAASLPRTGKSIKIIKITVPKWRAENAI